MTTVHSLPTAQSETLETLFPPVPAAASLEPLFDKILIQLRTARRKTRGGIIIADESRDRDDMVVSIGKVIAVGPGVFCNPDTGQPLPGHGTVQPGDIVRVPKYKSDNFWMRSADGEQVQFCFCLDTDMIGKVTDPGVLDAL